MRLPSLLPKGEREIMRSVFFGLGLQYDDGDGPGIAINNAGHIVEVHKNELGLSLYYRTGQTDSMNVNWDDAAKPYTGGVSPSIALNNNDRVVEVHKNEAGISLYYRVGQLSGSTITWGGDKWTDYTSGLSPCAALNDSNDVVEVHESEKTSKLYWRYGVASSSEIDWKNDDDWAEGVEPRVAINNNKDVVEVHRDGSDLRYSIGKIVDEKVEFESSHSFGTGSRPGVGLTNSGDVVVTWEFANTLIQRFGKIQSNGEIQWSLDEAQYDSGVTPCVAASSSSGMCIEAHEGTILKTLWSSTSIITDRAVWMTERRAELGSKTIRELVLPASHDSAMYLYGLATLGKTQYLSIFDQLEYGIRYFDLRPKKSGDTIVIHHGPIDGPTLATVLDEIRNYCLFGHKELIIIDWGEFTDFENETYQQFTSDVEAKLGQWQYKGPLPSGQRLGDIPLSTYTANGPCIISAVDFWWAIDFPAPGFWVYRKCDDENSNQGQLVVYDYYSETTSYEEMRDDQLTKFEAYTGWQKYFPNLPCDIFLLSWTCTPITGVWFESVDPNRHLGKVIAETNIRNSHGRIMNALYVDYCEFARVTDVGIVLNNKLDE